MKISEKSSFLKQYGYAMVDRRYLIVPIKRGYKYPKGLGAWAKIKATREHVDQWLANGFANGGVGLLTRQTPAIDIDVYDSAIVHKLASWCHKHIGTTVKRIGQAPKLLLVYRCEQPFAKITSAKYRDEKERVHQVEVLGDGQQFVAYAEHPITKRPYEWFGDKSIVDVLPNDLPLLTAEQARAFVDFFERIVPHHWKKIEDGHSGASKNDDVKQQVRLLANIKPKADITTEQLKVALKNVNAEGYDQWVRVGMALYHQYSGDATGFELWDGWSKTSSKYRAHEIETKWQTFEANLRQEPVTAATILSMARVTNDKEQGDLVGAFLDRYIYVQDGDRVCDINKPSHCCLSRLNEFKNRTANVRHEIPTPTQQDPDKTKLDPVWKTWLVHPRRKSAEGTEYTPREGRIVTDAYGLDWINEFHMPKFAETDSNSELVVFFDHMTYLFPKPKEKEWFISWMAFNLQYPERRCKVVPLHVSVEHGTGRGWVVELLGKLLGQWNCSRTKMDTLSGECSAGAYQDYLNKSIVCAIEEVKEGNKRFSVSDKIRDRLTEPYLEVNLKYGGKKTQKVFTNFFFMSNHPDALVLTTQDRRINVFENPHKPRSERYYDKLYAWLESDGVTQLYNFLMTRDLSSFNWKRSIDTEARTRMIHNNRTETEVLFWDLMENPHYPVMTFQQIVREMKKLSDKDEFETNVEQGQLTKLLQHHAERISKQLKVPGINPVRPWVLVPGADTTNEKMRESIVSCGV